MSHEVKKSDEAKLNRLTHKQQTRPLSEIELKTVRELLARKKVERGDRRKKRT